jgi:NAD(P)-dependent dehydrogenase (short-subunit alcohol dehydrogenase family)
MRGIQDRTALVTGAGSGIGRASARRFAEEGASVVVADIDAEGGAETVELIEDAGGEATFVEADVTDDDEVAAMVETAVETYGGLHFAHNNAGIGESFTPTIEMAEAEWERFIDVNLEGVWRCIKHELPHLLEEDDAAIVNTASVAAQVGLPGLAHYVASKHGVAGLTKNVALEHADEGLRVNGVCPGIIDTAMARANPDFLEEAIEMTPMDRAADPSEVAGPVVWLCSADASFVTGELVTVDGGQMAQ